MDFFALKVPCILASILLNVGGAIASNPPINRHAIVSRYNPTRNASSSSTPLQVGNGNFAFGADITGLQTFQPFATMSSWGWKNDTLPTNVTMDDILSWNGTEWFTHGRLVDYAFSPGSDVVGSWLISNPNRVNLGRIGLTFLESSGEAMVVSEDDLEQRNQTLDLWAGALTSHFVFQSTPVSVNTWCSPSSDTVGVEIHSSLIGQGTLGIFFDFPWHDGHSKFEAPFVGSFNNATLHTTELSLGSPGIADIAHTLGASTFHTTISWDEHPTIRSSSSLSRDDPSSHRYTLRPHRDVSSDNTFSFTATYSKSSVKSTPDISQVKKESSNSWESFWSTGGFVDVVTRSTASGADELQRRIILSQYLLAVNEAGDDPPQESGLVNNGWYGKFHLEMVFWHMAHWSLWSKQKLLNGATSIYPRFLSSSVERARKQGYLPGARWGKMSDPSGRSAPGEINALLIWQQPHPIFFAELEYRSATSASHQAGVLAKWDEVVENTADFMTAYAWWNESTSVYDLGPPMYPVSENTEPNVTMNPAFELAYWRLGLGLAETWRKRQGKPTNPAWTKVRQNLASLPMDAEGRYVIYEGLDAGMWTDPNLTSDHPALVGLNGWLPPVDGVNLTAAALTAQHVWDTWNISDSYGWDMPMLAMSAARLGNATKAVEWLLHPLFQFDDAGMPVGGVRVPTPYFPASGGFLYAVAMMAAGWDGDGGTHAPGFPPGWHVRTEGMRRAI